MSEPITWECPECKRRVVCAVRPECLHHSSWRYDIGEQPVMRKVAGHDR